MNNRFSHKTVFLHIGIGKTGTSSIQEMMFRNRKYLSERGVFYPEIGLHNVSHHLLTSLLNKRNSLKSIQKSLLKIRDRFVNEDCTKLLISSEQLCYSRPALVGLYGEIFKDFNVKIIFYIRRQETLISSTFLEWVKNGWDYKGNIEAFFNFNKAGFDLKDRLISWEENFGKSSINVFLYDLDLFSDVCAHFLNCIGFEGKKLNELSYSKKVNTSLIPDLFELVRSIDNLNLNKRSRADIIMKLLLISDSLRNCSQNNLIDEKLQKKIAITYKVSNHYVAMNYLSEQEREIFLSL